MRCATEIWSWSPSGSVLTRSGPLHVCPSPSTIAPTTPATPFREPLQAMAILSSLMAATWGESLSTPTPLSDTRTVPSAL